MSILHIFICKYIYILGINHSLYLKAYKMQRLAKFVKMKRRNANLTQSEFAERAGVALTVIRKIEQGDMRLNLEKVNQVLKMFGHELAPVSQRELTIE